MTTDPVDAEAARAERLARLQARQAQRVSPKAKREDRVEPSAAPKPSVRRQSPAAASKIAVAGASTVGVLGLIAAYGLTDRPAPAPITEAAPQAPAVGANATSTPPTAQPPVVVIVVEGAAGSSGASVDAGQIGGVTTTVADAVPAAVEAPATVALAVPAPPPQLAAPAAPPQATSSGS